MGARGDDRGVVVAVWLIGAMIVCGMAGFASFKVWKCVTSGGPKYTVTITGVDGLDPALDLRSDRRTLSPVFNITVHIDNALDKVEKQCVGGDDSSAVVSYGDAQLGKGAVPAFCAQILGVGESTATAWGMNVELPRFLRNRLAGELERDVAVVDVAVRRTLGGGSCYTNGCRDEVLHCKAKIGGGSSPSPCFLTQTIGGTAANT